MIKEAFKSIFHENKSKIATQEGCYEYSYCKIFMSQTFFTYSKWKSQVHLDQYRNTDLFKRFGHKQKHFFAISPLLGAFKRFYNFEPLMFALFKRDKRIFQHSFRLSYYSCFSSC